MTDDDHIWHRVASAGEIDEDEPKAVKIGDLEIALYKVDGAFYATADMCTHEAALLSDGWVEGDAIECPIHQARFHIPTGKCLSPPADTDLETYPVRVEGDDIHVGLPKRP